MKVSRCAFALLLCLPSARADDLVLNQFPQPIPTFVFEVPGLPAQALDQLKAGIRQKFPDSAIIDAVATEEAVLREKLQGPWALLTLLDEKSRLLKLTAEPLPLRVENGTVRWDDLAIPAREARVAFMGRNPNGSGLCMVYALGAGQKAQLRSSDMGSSFVIHRGEELVRRGMYDRQFRNRDSLTAAGAAADVEEFFSRLDRVHPDVHATLGPAGYTKLRSDTRRDAAALADAQGNVRVDRLSWLLMYAAAALRDGHTGAGWRAEPGRQTSGDVRFPPFWLSSENGRLWIASAQSGDLVGMELLQVNGAAAAEFLKPVLDRCSGETVTWRIRQFASDQRSWLERSNLFGQAGRGIRLRLRDQTGREIERTVETLGAAEFDKLCPSHRPHPTLRVQTFDAGKIALFVSGFVKSDAEKARVVDAVRQVRDSGARDLIVDLRGNGGGNSDMGDFIFRRIWKQPVEQVSETRFKLSPEMVAEARKHLPAFPPEAEKFIAGSMGQTLSSRNPLLRQLQAQMEKLEAPDVPAAVYSGRLWLLVDNGTFSAANLFAAAFRDYGMGKIVGYETGQPPIGFGDCPSFTLAHSGISYRISTKQFFPPKPRPEDKDRGVQPDVPLDRETLASYRAERDPELAFTLDLIRRQPAARQP